MSTSPQRGNVPPEGFEVFFEQWNIYRKVIAHDYMMHQEIYAAVRAHILSKVKGPFSMLELGCGDASFTREVLKDTEAERYVGIEMSAMAVGWARENLEPLSCEKTVIEGDFVKEVGKAGAGFDVILAGYSLHHLKLEQKREFLGRCRPLIKEGGMFFVLDGILEKDEPRDSYIDRWWHNCETTWDAMTEREKELIREHVYACDFPEALDTFSEMGEASGFGQIETIFRDPDGFYQFICLYAD